MSNSEKQRCDICERVLNDPYNPTTADCGGTCVRCMADSGDPDCIETMEEIRKARQWDDVDTYGPSG